MSNIELLKENWNLVLKYVYESSNLSIKNSSILSKRYKKIFRSIELGWGVDLSIKNSTLYIIVPRSFCLGNAETLYEYKESFESILRSKFHMDLEPKLVYLEDNFYKGNTKGFVEIKDCLKDYYLGITYGHLLQIAPPYLNNYTDIIETILKMLSQKRKQSICMVPLMKADGLQKPFYISPDCN